MNIQSPLLEIKNLTVSYSTSEGPLTAVRDVSLEIQPGQALGLAGESGSGKSTVGLALLGLFGPEANIEQGSIRFNGRDLLKLSAQQRRDIRGDQISVVFQDPFTSLNPALPIGLQVAEPLVFHRGLSESQALERVVKLLADVDIRRPEETINAFPHQLSGGMQQRVLIATAVACEPELLILDEPTTALDVTIEANILDLLRELCLKNNLSILYISHDLGVIARLCETVCILYAGNVLEIGPTPEIFDTPRHPYTKGLLASLSTLAVRKGKMRLAHIPGTIPDLTQIPSGCVFHPRCPFGEKGCEQDEQRSVLTAPGHWVRCWKADAVADKPWSQEVLPLSPNKETGISPKENGRNLIQTENVIKEFNIGGFFSGIRFQIGGPGPWISYKPQKVTAIDRASIFIGPGEVLGLVGESGSGKTTLGRCLVRLLEPSSGRIVFNDQDVTHLPEKHLKPLRQRVQIIFQNPDSSLNPRKTIAQIVGRPLTLFGINRRTLKQQVGELLEMVRLSPALYAGRYPHQLSGGEKQRVGIARALATSPRFIVCDEAVSALDVSVQAAILNLLDDLREELNLTYLFISHDISVVAHMASRVAVMYRGWICETGTTEEVLTPPYHPYTEALLSAIPSIENAAGKHRIRLKGDPLDEATEMKGCRFHPRCPRKIGAICETKPPPILEISNSHRISCHLPLDDLKGVASMV